MIEDWVPGYDAKTGAVVVPRVIENFPYPQRFCPFCEREITVVNAAHSIDEPIIYKCIYICDNPKCGAFDEEAKKAYARVYYSCEEALQAFETVMLKFRVEEKW